MLVSLPLKIGIHSVLGEFIPFLIAMLYNGIDMSSSLLHDTNYQHLLSELKTQIRQSQVKAALAVNAELVLLYWHIGTSILEKQATQGWLLRRSCGLGPPSLARPTRVRLSD